MKRWLTLCAAAVLLLAGWRPVPKEPEGLALVRVLGVDGPGPVTLTAVCGGDGQEESEPCTGQCAGADFERALEVLPWSGEKELSITSVSYIIIGRDIDLREVLLAVLRNEELGAAATIWLADEGAAALLARCENPSDRLDLLTRQGVKGPTAVEALAGLERGKGPALPVLTGEELTLAEWEEWRGAA